jgi:hypothetical protein
MRARRPEESWEEYRRDTGMPAYSDPGPGGEPGRDPNRSGPAKDRTADHVSVEESTPQGPEEVNPPKPGKDANKQTPPPPQKPQPKDKP